ncbi:MAG: ABC transporter ATP-binding protein [Acidimicrobiia bacterium]|nr:ABC transporter ATP-binding protein [Acidimicrobiia bacterium]
MIACHQVRAAYNGSEVLRGIDLEVAAGEWVALIGPNGAGKSSLLRVIAGALGASGTVDVGGHDPRDASRTAVATTVAFVPQHPVLPEGMSVFDYALLGRTPYIKWWGVESSLDVEITHQVLDRVDMDTLAHRNLDRLSGGELQRAILARALVQQTPVLLLDEPTAALDIGHQQQVLDLIDELRHEKGLAVLSAFHDLTVAGQYADRLVLMAEGIIAASGEPTAVLDPSLLNRHYGAQVNVLHDADGNIVVALRRGG